MNQGQALVISASSDCFSSLWLIILTWGELDLTSELSKLGLVSDIADLTIIILLVYILPLKLRWWTSSGSRSYPQ